jgi:copper chaperone NosL
MRALLLKANRFFDQSLDWKARAIVLAAVLLLIPTTFLPMWKMTMYANQYPDGLRLAIHSWKLEAGNKGIDLQEINTLNHYIGMKPLDPKDFLEFKWLPFAIGFFILFGLRTVVIGKVVGLVDLLVLFIYFGIFSLASFYYRLYVYGHYLEPTAAVKVPPFTPPIIGHQTLANFEVYSFPGLGSYCMGIVPLLLALALFLAWRSTRKESAPALAPV